MTTSQINYSLMKKNRETCVLCDSKNLVELFKFNMPLFMGVNKNNSVEHIHEMTFLECADCHEGQIKELIDLDILYNSNHNIGVIGETWKNHYVKLSEFIKNDISDKTILEISDPSAKIASLSTGFKEWVIIEPNPDKFELENVRVIKTFFDDDFEISDKVDVIIHSHLLEHMHDPKAFFKKCHETLADDGKMFISVPDMEFLASKDYSPNNILHFEHTYYLDESVLKYLASKSGFKVVRTEKYNNHSIFYELVKSEETTETKIKLVDFNDLYQHHIRYIKYLHIYYDMCRGMDAIPTTYLFGAHVSSQFYLFNGFNTSYLSGILDNSKEKQDHTLYGTNMMVKSPDILAEKDKCVVITSHSGIYQDEINAQLIKINPNITFL